MQLDLAAVRGVYEQAFPTTEDWSGPPESCYGSDAPQSKRVPVTCPNGGATADRHGLSRSACQYSRRSADPQVAEM
jgi:hypothetical protein